MKITKKLSIFITIFVLIFGVQFAQPKKAEAFLGIGDISIDLPNLLKEFGIDTLVTILQNRILNKLIDDTINWANGGFDGEPGFINNWDGFLEGTKHDILASTFHMASKVAGDAAGQYNQNGTANISCKVKAMEAEANAYEACIDPEELLESECTEEANDAYTAKFAQCNNAGSLYGDVGNIAEQNYNAYMNGNLVTTRSVATTIANYGAKELNMDPVTDLINGQGNTLTYLLGSQAAVDTFGQDITQGGWNAYMALSDPHNYPSGLNSLVTGALGSKTEQTVSSKVESMQTPQKYEDKRKCIEWEAKQSRTGEGSSAESRICLRYETQTPGSLIEGKVKKSLTKDEDQSYLARELSDVLAKALGRLTDGLLQAGMNAIAKKMKGGNAQPTLQEKIDETFSNSYQNAYDVLGIADDAALFNEEQIEGNAEANTNLDNMLGNYLQTTGDDASIPYVGGPEDLEGFAWDEGPELIVELKGNLDKAVSLTEQLIDIQIQTKQKLNSVTEKVGDLDHCRPGPDFGWEDRYTDIGQSVLADIGHKDETECSEMYEDVQAKFFDIGLPIAKQMNADPFVNIPGSGQISSVVNAILGEDTKLQLQNSEDNLKEKKAVYNLLLYMKEQARTAPNYIKARDLINPKIPLFQDDIFYTKNVGDEKVRIDKLSDADIVNILNIESQNKNTLQKTSISNSLSSLSKEIKRKTYLIEAEGLYVFKDELGETAESLVAENREKAEELILSLGWKIWRKNTDRELKGKLRYQYHTMENDLTTEKDVLEADIKLKDAENNVDRIEGYVADCSTFVSSFKDKPDSYIKDKLAEEYNKQQESRESMFQTELFTMPANVQTSILKYQNQEEIERYLNTMYPEAKNLALSVIDILEQDKTYRTIIQNNAGTSGTTSEFNPFIGVGSTSSWSNPNMGKDLYCETPKYEYRKWKSFWGKRKCLKSHSKHLCYSSGQTWYYSKSIVYTSALAGI